MANKLTPTFHLLRFFLAVGWLRAASEKLIDGDWWTGSKVETFIDDHRSDMLPFYGWFADLVERAPTIVAVVVLLMEVVIGLCLALNRYTVSALWAGIVLNLAFTMAGQVNPSAFYLVMEIALLLTLTPETAAVGARRRAGLWFLVAVALLPFARTLRPSEVIEDPALVLALLAVLTGGVGLLGNDRGAIST